MQKVVFLLIGPKGSGKSFIGTLFETRFDIKFIRVEDWAKSVKRERAVDDQSYIEEVFRVIENGIRHALRTRDTLVFESTGLSRAFDDMLENLRSEFQVVTIRVNADEELCLSRVKTRDQNIHINVSDDQVRTINALVAERALSTDFAVMNNSGDLSQLERDISAIVSTACKGNNDVLLPRIL